LDFSPPKIAPRVEPHDQTANIGLLKLPKQPLIEGSVGSLERVRDASDIGVHQFLERIRVEPLLIELRQESAFATKGHVANDTTAVARNLIEYGLVCGHERTSNEGNRDKILGRRGVGRLAEESEVYRCRRTFAFSLWTLDGFA
jgi:hypothetical protein